MKTNAIIRLHFPSQRVLKAVSEALNPETQTTPSRRSKAQIHVGEDTLTLILEARDTSALRATVNAYLRWILLTKTIVESTALAGSKVHG